MNIEQLRIAARAIYLATDEKVADDVSHKLKWAADKIEAMTKEVSRLARESVEREKTVAKLEAEVESLAQAEEEWSIKLPCKIGDTVYYKDGRAWEVEKIGIYRFDTVFQLTHEGTDDYCAVFLSDLGGNWWVNREVAEYVLAERKGGRQ